MRQTGVPYYVCFLLSIRTGTQWLHELISMERRWRREEQEVGHRSTQWLCGKQKTHTLNCGHAFHSGLSCTYIQTCRIPAVKISSNANLSATVWHSVSGKKYKIKSRYAISPPMSTTSQAQFLGSVLKFRCGRGNVRFNLFDCSLFVLCITVHNWIASWEIDFLLTWSPVLKWNQSTDAIFSDAGADACAVYLPGLQVAPAPKIPRWKNLHITALQSDPRQAG